MNNIPVDLLETFVMVSRQGGFTAAARALNLRQSTVSQHIARLETLTKRRLIDRDTHRTALTVEGELLLDHAIAVLDAHHRLARSLSRTPLRGRLRLGASEDFVLSALPDILASFARRHPEVDLELCAGLSDNLYDMFDAGLLDLIFVKRRAGDARGTVAWQEPLQWLAHPDFRVDPNDALPLIFYPPPSMSRARAIEVLGRADTHWRIAFTSASLSGLTAAARAGIGVMPHSARLMPAGLAVLGSNPGLPQLPDIEFVVIGPGGHHPVAGALTAAIMQWAAAGRHP
jgi:DNA-binding transcriptional LysR family regulator